MTLILIAVFFSSNKKKEKITFKSPFNFTFRYRQFSLFFTIDSLRSCLLQKDASRVSLNSWTLAQTHSWGLPDLSLSRIGKYALIDSLTWDLSSSYFSVVFSIFFIFLFWLMRERSRVRSLAGSGYNSCSDLGWVRVLHVSSIGSAIVFTQSSKFHPWLKLHIKL